MLRRALLTSLVATTSWSVATASQSCSPAFQHACTASDASSADQLGICVAVSEGRALGGAIQGGVGALNSGAAYLFDLASGAQLWEWNASDASAGDLFGHCVALDDAVAAIGAPLDDDLGNDSGSVYVFDAHSAAQLGKLNASDGAAQDQFGHALALGGADIVVGARLHDSVASNAGALYVFDRSTLTQRLRLTASDAAPDDWLGFSVAACGRTAVAGARNADAAGLDSGAAYVFDLVTGAQRLKLLPSDGAAGDQFGYSIAIDGALVAVGARFADGPASDAGAVYVFDARTGAQLAKLVAADAAANDWLGFSVTLSGTTVVAGAAGDDDAGPNSGSVYVFDALSGVQRDKLTAANASSGDQFGMWVSLEGPALVVGSRFEDAAANDAGALLTYAIDCGDGAPFSHCAGKPNSAGCEPRIQYSGVPRANSVTPFGLSVHDVLNGKTGLFFYGVAGRKSAPFQDGLLCVRSPTRRTSLQSSGGSMMGNDCTGTLALDFNALIQSGSDPTLTSGVRVDVQSWYRDPLAASTTGLSNALAFVIEP